MLRLRVKELAGERGLNRNQLQLKSGVTLPLLTRYWNNETRAITLDALERIARALGVKAVDLIEEIPAGREHTMLINNLEQIIDQLPGREFSYTFSSGIKVSLRHESLWHGEMTDTNNSNRHLMSPCHAQTFQEVSDSLVLHGLLDQNVQELLDAAKKLMASKA